MAERRDAVVSGLLAAGLGVVTTLALSALVAPPLALPVMAAVIAVATFLVGAYANYAVDQAE
jgi:uncharacterized membrane protein YfcA